MIGLLQAKETELQEHVWKVIFYQKNVQKEEHTL
jgi:hypothetical protein